MSPISSILGSLAPTAASAEAQTAGAGAGPRTVSSLGFAAPGQVAMFSYEEGVLPAGQFRVQTLYTGLSAGTELTHFKGTNQYLQKTWDDSLKLFRPGAATQQYPLMFSGYMEVGRVIASDCAAVAEGQLLAMSYGHKTGHTADPRQDFYVPLPAGLDPVLGIYVAQMGPICANAILHADDDAYGAGSPGFGSGVARQRIVVFGSGVIGLLTALMARWAGAAEVVVVDNGAARLAVAGALGLDTVDMAEVDPATWVKERWSCGPGADRGADLAFQCRASDHMLAAALDCLRPQGTVIDLAFYQGGAPAVQLGEAFHHNGLRHVSAQIFRVPRRLQHSWDRARLSQATVQFLLECGADVKRHLITDIVPLTQAQGMFEDIAAKRRPPLQVVFSVAEDAR
ncbi:MAG: zinc-binding alcohol dehydrogenase [Chloroflexota bacterium]|nr:zinc-binding alcohol dehydrogenase [Chloroflexota bacterium]